MATKVASARGSDRSALQASAQVSAAGARGPPAHRGRRGATGTHSGRATALTTVETAPQRIIFLFGSSELLSECVPIVRMSAISTRTQRSDRTLAPTLQSTQIGKATDPVFWVPLNHTISWLSKSF